MPHFLAEGYLAEATSASLASDVERVRAATRTLVDVTFVQSLYLPGDEVCFLLFECASAELADRAAALAGVDVDRVVPVSVSVAPAGGGR